MKSHLTTLHEALHAVGAVVAVAGIPGGTGRFLTAFITLESRDPCGPGEIRFQQSEKLRAHHEWVQACSACGPLAFFGDAPAIGRAIAEGRHGEVMSETDIEISRELSPVDQYVIGRACQLWLLDLSRRNGIAALNRALSDSRVRFHGPLPIPCSAFITDMQAGQFRFEARRTITRDVPARSALSRPVVSKLR